LSTFIIYKFLEIKTIAVDLIKFIENLYNKIGMDNTIQEQSFQSPIPVKRTHLPLILVILGVLKLLFVITFSFSVLRQMQFMNSSQDISFNPSLSYLLIGVATLIALAEIGIGIFFTRKQKIVPLTKNYKIASIALLVGGLLLFGIVNSYLIQLVISPIYNLTSEPLSDKQEGSKNSPVEIPDGTIEYIDSDTGIIKGQITDLALKPLGGVTVYEQNRKISTQTDSNGLFAFENVIPGQVMLNFTHTGYSAPIQGFNISAGMKITKKFTMSTVGTETGGVEGMVTLNSAPQQNIEVFTFAGGKIVKAVTDNSGKYILQGISPDDGYRIIAAKENYSPISEIVIVSSKINTKVDFNFATKLKGITVNGFISNTEGKIITNATVGFGYNSLLKTYNSSTGSDATGFYQTGDWQQSPWPSKIPIEVSAPGYKIIKDEISPVVGTSYIKHYVLEKN